MGRCARHRNEASFPGRHAGQRRYWRPGSAIVFIDLIIVLIILGILASIFASRYNAPDFSGQARQQAARAALAEGYTRLNMATACFVVDNGDLPENLTEMIPDYLNATTDLGDYTAVYIQGNGEITVEIHPATTISGMPLATRTFSWP